MSFSRILFTVWLSFFSFVLGRELRQLADCTTSFIIHPTGNGFQRLSLIGLIPSSTSNGFHSFILRVV